MTSLRTCSVLLLLALSATPSQAQLAAGDRAWEARAEGLEGRLARTARIDAAIGFYRAACDTEANPLQARWKLLRALHYLIDFTDAAASRKDEAVDEAVSLVSTWIETFDEGSGSAEDRAQLYFWSAIVWGARGQRVGLLTIVREGVARRMHEYAERAVALDPAIERGGGYRLLSRLHAELPRVPLVSGWVDRNQVLPLAERAFSIDGDDAGNRVILAMALDEQAPDRRTQAATLLESVAQSRPRPYLLAEDLAIREQALQRLEKLRGISPTKRVQGNGGGEGPETRSERE
jgi:hypothetical protein